jgi:hypothetical protein
LQEPVAVFSYGDKGKAQNVIVELSKNGKNLLAGTHFGQGETNINYVRTLFHISGCIARVFCAHV